MASLFAARFRVWHEDSHDAAMIKTLEQWFPARCEEKCSPFLADGAEGNRMFTWRCIHAA
jgi:hypothetical protein